MKHFLVCFFTLIYGLVLFKLKNGYLTDFDYSIYYILFSIFSLSISWISSNKKINLFLLYIATFHLFIGGRFFVCVFDRSLSPFEPTFFYQYSVTKDRIIDLMIYVYSFIYFVTIGHYFSRIYPLKKPFEAKSHYINKRSVSVFAKKTYPFLGVCLLYMAITAMMHSFQEGYAVVDFAVTEKAHSVSFVSKYAPMLLILLVASTFVYAKKFNKRFLILYALYGFTILLGGSRAAFGSVLLLTVWLYTIEHKVSMMRVGITVAGGLMILLFIFALSARGHGLDGFTFFDALKVFMYDNGVSLMVFDTSRLVDDYPLLPYLQTFIPGVSVLYSLITGITLYPQNISFSGHMCYTINQSLFDLGAGLGWTTLSDLYVYSAGIVFVFCLFSFLLGAIFANLEHWAKTSLFYKFLLFSITPGVLSMARGTLTALFVQLIYSLLAYILFSNVFKWLKSKKSIV